MALRARERCGQCLHGLAPLLQLPATPSVREAGSALTLACASQEALTDAVAQLRAVLRGLIDEASRERTEVPIIGSTRCVLGPGGELLEVLTAGQHCTLSVSGFRSDAAAAAGGEEQLACWFGAHGEVLSVRLLQLGDACTARVTMATAAQAAAAAAALHNKALPGGARLAVVGYTPPSAQQCFRPASLLHLSWSGGRPSGLAYVEFASGRAAVDAAVKLAKVSCEAAGGFGAGGAAGRWRGAGMFSRDGRRGMLRVDGGAWFFAQASRASRRVLQLKVCGEEREEQTSPPMLLLRDRQRLERALSERFGPVSKLSVLQEPDPGLRRRECQPAVLAARLRSLLGQYGSLVHLDVKPYNDTKQIGSAFACFSSAQEAAAARGALDGCTAHPWLSGSPLRAHSDLVCRLRLDGRCFRALRGRLAHESNKLRALCPGVKISIKSLSSLHPVPVMGPAGGPAHPDGALPGGSGGGGASIKLQGSDVGQVVRAKRAMEAACSGRAVQLAPDGADGPAAEGGSGGAASASAPVAGMLFLLSAPGKALIKQIEAEFSGAVRPAGGSGGQHAEGPEAGLQQEEEEEERAQGCVHIRWDRAAGQLRMYGSDDAAMAAAEQRLRRALQERQAGLAAPVAYKEGISQAGFRALLAAGGQAWLDGLGARHSLVSADMAFLPLGVKLVGEAAAVEAARTELLAMTLGDLPSASPGISRVPAPDPGAATPAQTPLAMVVTARDPAAAGGGAGDAEAEGGDGECCPVCFCPPDGPHKLLLCGHTYCATCVRQLLVAAASCNQLPATCCAESCGGRVSLRDCLVLLGPEQMERVHRSAFQAHIGRHPEAFGFCLTPDCGQVPWHSGQTCAEYKAGRQGDKEFEAWKRTNTKSCPKCGVAIEKNHGCNHMTCANCRTHFCWKCGKAFGDSTNTYQHLMREHGGVFDDYF
ncbi:hypothetical protein GPECTOR_6g534 [Gonium pectorale]|uniref:RBR-type E3 ubiquitin transferase n=1 Tax=Gonium pectorale TaxID=33097 RepID=A0A150GUR2_GONPE|nr:hypothetical protein GPECTOR_6g534 [Gonium pectorale]|eukprot:KXZ53617.1 hypothetical protein GPECTOR_6g534 [Gonium pectorale]